MNFIIFYISVFYLSQSVDSFSYYQTNIAKFFRSTYSKVKNESSDKAAPNELINVNAFKTAFEGFRSIIDDPMIIGEQKVDFEVGDLLKNFLDWNKIQGRIKEVKIKNLKTMTLDYVNITEDNSYFEFIVTIPVLEFSGLYNISVTLKPYYNVEFDGNGPFKLNFENYTVKVNFTIKGEENRSTEIHDINCDLSFNNSIIEIQNVMNDQEVSKIISETLTVGVPALHNYVKPFINNKISEFLLIKLRLLNLKFKDIVMIIHELEEKKSSS